MANETNVGGIVAPVKADIGDFMAKFDQVNQKTNVVSQNVINRLEMMSRALHDVNAQSLNIATSPQSSGSSSVTQSQVSGLNNVSNSATRAANNVNLLNDAFGKMKSHVMWMATATISGAAVMAPFMAIKSIADVEQQMAGMLQTLPSLYQKAADGIQTHTVNQAALNEVTKQFIGLSAQYGFEVDKTIEAGKLWSRGYKEVGDVMKLTGNSMKLAIADMMDVTLANRAVESTISGFKRQGDAVAFSNHIVDSWTNVAHNAQSSANDLAESLIRSGAAANVVGVSFDMVTAMAATMIRATGQSGAIVGNSLKSIFSTLDSTKGRAALEDLGIGMYNLDKDGTKHLRNMEHVIIDVMLAVSGTNKSLQKDFEGMSSKFQWGRAAAMFGDYAEFIKNYNLSINSSGVADQQVMAQLDTINRKVEQIKANMTGAVMGPANAGLGKYIKDWLDSVNMFTKGLQQIPTETFVVIGSLTKMAVAIFAIKSLVGLFITGWAGVTAAIGAATAATTVFASATAIATGGLSLIAGLIITAGVGAAVYAANVGEAANAIEKERQATADSIATKESQIAMNTKQIEFIGTLGNAYTTLQEKLVQVQGDEVKTAEINKNIEATHKELAIVVGKSAADRILASDDIKGAISEEQKVHAQKTDEMKTTMDDLIKTQSTLTNAVIAECNERIKSINHEADSIYTASQSIKASLGSISSYMYDYYQSKASYFTDMSKGMDDKGNAIAGDSYIGNFDQVGEGVSNQYSELANQANANAKEIADKAIAKETAAAKTALSGGYSRGNSANTRTGGDIVTDPPDKEKNSGSNTSDPTKNVQSKKDRLESQLVKNKLFLEAKLSADDYSTKLDDIRVKELLFGVTLESSAEKSKVKNDRISELTTEQKGYSDQIELLQTKIDEEIAKDKELEDQLSLNGIAYKNLSKEGKAAVREIKGDFIDNESSLKTNSKLVDQFTSKLSESVKESKKLKNELTTDSISNLNSIYNTKIQSNNSDKELAMLGLKNNYSKEQADVIELTNALKNLELSRGRLKDLEDEPGGKTSVKYKEELITFGKLNNQIDLLKDKTLIVRTSMASMFDGMMRGTTTFGDFWRNACLDFGTQMINQIWNINKAGSQSSILGQIFGGIFGGKSVANTGQFLTSNNQVLSGPVQASGKFATGGQITGEGTGTSDSILIRASNGEFMMQDSAVKKYGVGFFSALNDGLIPKFATGGPITASNTSIVPDLSTVRTNNNNANANASGGNTQHVAVTIHQNYQSLDPATNMKLMKAQNASTKAEILNAIKTETSWRSAVKGAAR